MPTMVAYSWEEGREGKRGRKRRGKEEEGGRKGEGGISNLKNGTPKKTLDMALLGQHLVGSSSASSSVVVSNANRKLLKLSV